MSLNNKGPRDSFDMFLDTMDLALARPIAFLPVFSRITGSVTAALMLSQLRYWTKQGRDEWIFKTQDEMEEETTLTRREQETARRRLLQLRLIEVARRGVPGRLHYRINFKALVALISRLGDANSTMAESANVECTKAPVHNGGTRQSTMAESANVSSLNKITSEITEERPPIVPQGGRNGVVVLKPSAPEPEPEKAEPVTPEVLMEGWNEIVAPSGPSKCSALSPTRRRKCLLRIKEHPDLAFWEIVMTEISDSPFLRGLSQPTKEHPKPFRANFDWLIDNDVNVMKIHEGRYS